ncbi:MAG: efflux RND transporter periplasmic adaptor subunit [Hyphomicrobiales bacterium]|nr:efflux RND transporter periplasmic adaptor subunit [Hyphomicrobiales bacterium]
MAFWKQAAISLVLLVGFALGFALFTYGPNGIPGLSSGTASASIAVSGGARARPAPLVVLSEIEDAKTDDFVRSIGTAQAIERTMLYPEVSGRVETINVMPGQRVGEGDVVVQLDNHVQRFAVDRARLLVDDAEAQVGRFQELSARDTVSDVQLSNSVLALERARLDLQEAEDALARRAITAPFSGEIGLIDIRVGDYVTSTTPVSSLDERRSLIVEFRVPERFANQIATGQEMTLATPALPGLVLTGEISGMDSRIDTSSRTLTVQGTVRNDDDLIRPGMSFEVSLSFAGKSYPAVPSLAVQWDREGSYVLRADGNTAARADISIVARRDGQVLVNGGISAGDFVISEGTNAVRPDQPFRTSDDAFNQQDGA